MYIFDVTPRPRQILKRPYLCVLSNQKQLTRMYFLVFVLFQSACWCTRVGQTSTDTQPDDTDV